MKLTAVNIKPLIKRKIVTAALITGSIAAFATLGDGGTKTAIFLPSERFSKTISLKPNFNFRSNNLFNTTTPSGFIMLNTMVTYQKGNTTYIMPLKKKVLLDKIRFNPELQKF